MRLSIRNRRRSRYLRAVPAAALFVCATRAPAIAWNADRPTYSATSTNGLLDRPGMFLNEHVINNATGSRGTGTYLGDGWVLTAQHVIQNGGNYAQLATPAQISMNVGFGGWSQNYTADALYTPGAPGGADIALIHLAGTSTGLAGALPGVLESQIHSAGGEFGKIVQIGGFGYHGALGGTMATTAIFHRAYNIVGSFSGDQISITANASARLVSNGYVLGLGESGDSGSGVWLNLGADDNDSTYDYALAGALATSSGFNFGDTSNYKRTTSFSGWILSTAYAGRGRLTWDANPVMPGIQDGPGTWDAATANFGNGVDNYAWDSASTKSVAFGWHKRPAGTITLGQSITAQNLVFNPALTGTYTLAASGGGVTLNLASPANLGVHADATISAPIVGGVLNKAGVGTLTLSGSNSLSGVLTIGGGATAGGNVNGALRITRTAALAGVPRLDLLDNNAAYAVLELDGGAAPIALPAATTINVNANFAGTFGTGATVLRNVAGNNTIAGNLTYNVGGVGYGITSETGSSLTFTGNVQAANNSSAKTFWLRGGGSGAFTGTISGNLINLTVADPGTWSLTGPNTFGGVTTISGGGTLATNRLAPGGSASGIGQSPSAAANLVLSGGTLRYTGPTAATNRLFTVSAPGATLDASGSGPLTFSANGAIAVIEPAARSAKLVGGSNVVTLITTGTFDLAVGAGVTGAGIPTGAVITAIDHNAGTITLSSPVRSSSDVFLSFAPINRTLTLTGSNTAANTFAPALPNSSTGGKLALTKTGQGAWTLAGASTYTGPTNVSAGTLALATNASIASPNVAVAPGATFNVSGSLHSSAALTSDGTTNFGANPLAGPVTRSLASLSIGPSGLVTIAPSPVQANRTLLRLVSLSFAGTPAAPLGQLDLATNDLIVGNGDLAALTAAVASGMNHGMWDGPGIASSSAHTSEGTALALNLNADFPAEIDVKFTWLGDANLDGFVTAADWQLVELALLTPPAGPATWAGGDFNYDGLLTPDDLSLFTLGAALSNGQSIAIVPEPAIAWAGGFTLAILARRRQRR